MTRSLLLVDDDEALLALLLRFFEARGWSVTTATTGTGALERHRLERPDLVLLDLGLPDMDGLAVLRRLREQQGDVGVLMLTGQGDVETAVEAMRLGADDFLTKPYELQQLALVVDRAHERVRLRRSNRSLREPARERPDRVDLGSSPLMSDRADQVEQVAAGDAPVLLQGETGTGKGWLAQRIHERSGRARGPFVELNCGGLSRSALEAELFGQGGGSLPAVAGARKGLLEEADGGTLLLDEIADLPLELQPKLLDVLENQRFRRPGGGEERSVDVRLIGAAHRPVDRLVEEGRFRQDLYYRIAVLPVTLPPLRERSAADIAWLSYRLLEEVRGWVGGGPAEISDEAMERLVAYPWPGNIRELRNLLERVLILASDADRIEPHHLPPEVRRGGRGRDEVPTSLTLEEVERRHIARVLEQEGGNRSRAARTLGISRTTLYEKLDRYGLRNIGLD